MISSELILTEILHFLIALLLFLIFLQFYKPFVAAFAFIFGFFIDVDHFVDYFYYLNKFDKPFSLYQFFTGEGFRACGKVIIPLHGWEWVALLLLFALVLRLEFFKGKVWRTLSQILIVSAVSMFAHVLTDALTNGMYFYSYSFLYRFANRFDSSVICKP